MRSYVDVQIYARNMFNFVGWIKKKLDLEIVHQRNLLLRRWVISSKILAYGLQYL